MSYLFKSMHNPNHRDELVRRLRRLTPDRPAVWGRMSAPRMVVHLGDQMRGVVNPRPGGGQSRRSRPALVRFMAIYVIPWPKAKIVGPPIAFVSDPGEWERDVAELESLMERFAALDPDTSLPHTLSSALFPGGRGVRSAIGTSITISGSSGCRERTSSPPPTRTTAASRIVARHPANFIVAEAWTGSYIALAYIGTALRGRALCPTGGETDEEWHAVFEGVDVRP